MKARIMWILVVITLAASACKTKIQTTAIRPTQTESSTFDASPAPVAESSLGESRDSVVDEGSEPRAVCKEESNTSEDARLPCLCAHAMTHFLDVIISESRPDDPTAAENKARLERLKPVLVEECAAAKMAAVYLECLIEAKDSVEIFECNAVSPNAIKMPLNPSED